jgi:hypothetical protein
MRVLIASLALIVTEALIGRLPIGASYTTKLGVIAQGFVWERASAKNPGFPQDAQTYTCMRQILSG